MGPIRGSPATEAISVGSAAILDRATAQMGPRGQLASCGVHGDDCVYPASTWEC